VVVVMNSGRCCRTVMMPPTSTQSCSVIVISTKQDRNENENYHEPEIHASLAFLHHATSGTTATTDFHGRNHSNNFWKSNVHFLFSGKISSKVFFFNFLGGF
jgi:hypothetical protein